MGQYSFDDNLITLSVKKAPKIIRGILFLLAFMFLLAPITGMIISISVGSGFHIGFLIGIAIFSVLGFYLLRLALWNTHGEESVIFMENKINYEANYGWFKDGKTSISSNGLICSIVQMGYEEENNGVLRLSNGDSQIQCAVKMPVYEIEELISKIETAANRR